MGQKNALYFCAGLAIGILGTLGFLWFYQEPEPVKEEPPVEKEIHEEPKPSMDGRSSLELDYVPESKSINYAEIVKAMYKPETPDIPDSADTIEPHRITEEQFEDGNMDGNYDICGLTLYGDCVLADSTTDEILSETDAFVALGPNYTARRLLEIFSRAIDYTDDPVYIRNDQLFSQYEITYDQRHYKEVTGRNLDGSYG